MRRIREVLRLKHELRRSHREIARSLGIANSTVSDYARRASAAGLSWPLPEGLDDAALEAALFPPSPPSRVRRPEPDWDRVHRELQRHKGVTLELLWLEYREAHPDGYQYSWFCGRYREWRGTLDTAMRQVYRAGEKAFVDYAGPTFEVVDPKTGEVHDAMVFVGVLGASNHTFVDVTRSRSLPDWTMSHVRMFEHWGGVPELVIPDNEKAAVHRASRYEPELNPTYRELARHYGTTVLPARPGAPRDKAKAEAAVQNVERRIMAPLRDRKFFSLGELREAVAPLLDELNERPFKKIEGSRRSWFEDLDRPALSPLPAERYEYAEWRKARVNIDYHIQVAHALYSVPHQLGRREVDVRITAHTIEIFHRHRRVAAHLRIHARGAFSTEWSHMPAAHREHAGWTPSKLIAWGGRNGPHTAAFVEQLLARRPHPEQGYRSCLGLKDLLRNYGGERLEAACSRALRIGALTYRSVKSILATGLDRAGDEQHELSLPGRHDNIRGPGYYATPRNGKES
ncbi:MAG: IS21 family transposase [Gemmatimonadota bacterium]|nr:IS21 family transposase [Gemmatimonadota bacterium]